MIEFRDRFCAEIGRQLIVHTNTQAIADGANPFRLGTQKCCGAAEDPRAAGRPARRRFRRGLRRRAPRRREVARQGTRLLLPRFLRPVGSEQPASRALEPLNARIDPGESIRVFPLSNWTELDVWHYIQLENIPIVPLYFAKQRRMVVRGDSLHSRRTRHLRCSPAKSRKWSCAACARWAAPPAPAPSAPMPTPCRRSSRR